MSESNRTFEERDLTKVFQQFNLSALYSQFTFYVNLALKRQVMPAYVIVKVLY